MKRKMLFTILGIGLAASFSGSSLAESEKDCRHAGGTISTNFLDSSTTFGTATGDLGGAVGVSILDLQQNGDGSLTFHNQHHWVTTSGDTVLIADEQALGFPTPVPGLFAVSYGKGLSVAGGTGRFAGATGRLITFGAVDTQKGQVVLRYEGQVCFADREHH